MKVDARKMLEYLNESDEFASYDDWLRCGMALRAEFGNDGLALWALTHNATVTPDVIATKWNSFDSDAKAGAVTIKSLMKRAHELGWKGSVRQSVATMFGGVAQHTAPPIVPTAPAFPVPPTADQVAAEKAAASKANELPLIFFDEARTAPFQRYHIKGFIAEGATSSVFAQPKKMKSTIITDAGVHLAAGKADWRGHRIPEAKGVVYFAFERHIQVRQALMAYAIRDGLENIPFVIVPRLVNMLDPECVELITNAIDRVQQRYGIEVACLSSTHGIRESQPAAAAKIKRNIRTPRRLICVG
jgi:hypothetical protein